MKARTLLSFITFVAALLATSPASAADKEAEKAKVKKNVAASLAKFYKAKPAIADEVSKAPGYAVFTSYGLSFVVGGAGGSGIAHDNAAHKDTYMGMAQASAGPQVGISQNDMLLIFKNKKALDEFIAKGWEFGGGGTASAGAGGKSAGGGTGEIMVNDAVTYSLTRNGVELGANLAGTKFWKVNELN